MRPSSLFFALCLVAVLAPLATEAMGLSPHYYVEYGDGEELLVGDTALERALDLWDFDGDGYVSESEFHEVYLALFEPVSIHLLN